jgi:GntR family transcriptional regulator
MHSGELEEMNLTSGRRSILDCGILHLFLDLELSRLDLWLSLCYICSTVFRKPNPSSGVPIYVQLKEQIRHAIETGALSAGDQLPGIRGLAETLVVNPNTVIKVYRDLEQEGVLEIRHGLGAFIASRRRSRSKTEELRDAQRQVHEFVETLKKQGLDEGEIRRLFEAELAGEFQRR